MNIRKIKASDRSEIISMMHTFYASDAVHTNGSAQIFAADIDACIGESPYLEGYTFEDGECIVGYGMLAKSFSTEFGKPCIWIEDIYIKDSHRGLGIGSAFISLVKEKHPDHVIRLEVEEENKRAVHLYEKAGFVHLPYTEMICF